MSHFIELILTIVISVVASSGFWTFMQYKLDKKDARSEMLRGLAHDRLVTLCEEYIAVGKITTDQYENLMYLYKPYKKLKGDGTVDRLMAKIDALPIASA